MVICEEFVRAYFSGKFIKTRQKIKITVSTCPFIGSKRVYINIFANKYYLADRYNTPRGIYKKLTSLFASATIKRKEWHRFYYKIDLLP